MRDARRLRERPTADVAAAPEGPAERPAPELLADDRVAVARMATVRAGLALQLQRGGGNAALGRILARDTATAAPARAPLKTGKELDAMLLASSFFAPYIKPKIAQGIQAEGHVHIHDPEAFKAEALKYLRGKQHPKTGQTFTDETAAEFEPTLRGFQDDRGEVRISERRADDGVVVHEAMHLFSSVAFIESVGHAVNEGVTEVFARRLASENGIMRAGWPTQHRLAAQLVVAAGSGGEKLLADAYFKNEAQPLIAAIDKKKGAGTWQKWVAAMQEGRFEDADALV
jgi:hypothetical protein